MVAALKRRKTMRKKEREREKRREVIKRLSTEETWNYWNPFK